jgi:Arc/MetJ-type ribon-helix-helix transcriptional regulator
MADTEKITINMNPVELGKVDLLVEQGHYANRTDFIRAGIRSQLEKHTAEVQQAVAHHAFVVGVLSYDRAHLARMKARHKKMAVTVIGVLRFQADVTPELARDVVESVRVRGVFTASEEVKAALADRMQ